MTVAYLLGSLNRGGTETLVLDTFRNAQKAGYQMIGIYRHEGAYLTDFQQTGVPFIHCAVKKHRFITYFLQLRKVLLQNNVQIVHAQQFIDCLYAKLATLGTSIKIVETFHGYDFDASWLNRRLIDLSMRLADRVCFVSMNEKEYYLKAYNKKDSDKYQVVYNGISFDKLDQQYEEPDFLQQTPSTAENLTKIDPPQAGITHYRLRMAMVGNFVSVRSQSIVCRAIDLLAQRGVSDFDFYFIGRRNEQEPWRYDDCVTFCRDRHLNHVHFMGGRADVPAILQHLDAFVYSTDHDTFGIAVVEAMAAGLPVFVNDWGVMCEIINFGGQNNMLWQTSSPESLADMLSDFFSAPEKYKQQALSAKPNIRNAFSIEQHIKRLNQLYNSIN